MTLQGTGVDTPLTTCPKCGAVHDRTANMPTPNEQPIPGDFVICISCYAILRYTSGLGVREAAPLEVPPYLRDRAQALQTTAREVAHGRGSAAPPMYAPKSMKEAAKTGRTTAEWPAYAALRYAIPRSHYPWELLGGLAALTAAMGIEAFPDESTRLLATNLLKLRKENWPVYCLSNPLLQDFMRADTESLEKVIPPDWEIPLPGFLIILPQNAFTTVEGSPIPFFMISCSESAARAAEYGEDYRFQIDVSFAAWDMSAWSSCFGIRSGRVSALTRDMGQDTISEAEDDWLGLVRAVTLQCVLSLGYLDDLVEVPEESPQPAAQRSKRYRKPKAAATRSPRWLGRLHKSELVASGKKGAAIAPRATHWRQGHWRNQPYGPGRKKTKIIYLKPTLVNQK